MRISDWSSDVCSSDLEIEAEGRGGGRPQHCVARAAREVADSEHHVVRPLVHWTGVQINALRGDTAAAEEHLRHGAASAPHYPIQIGRAAWRGSVCPPVSVSVGAVHLQIYQQSL